jgi:hypothetical protein
MLVTGVEVGTTTTVETPTMVEVKAVAVMRDTMLRFCFRDFEHFGERFLHHFR